MVACMQMKATQKTHKTVYSYIYALNPVGLFN